MDFDAELRRCARALGEAPRRFPLLHRFSYLRIQPPRWVKDRDDDLSRFFSTTNRLLTSGRLTWGCLVQANQLLFEPGPDDCPGEVLYSTESSCSLASLREVASAVYELKGTQQPDPAFAKISQYLANELTRVFGLQVPTLVSGTTSAAISTTFFVRRHLPRGVLALPWFPLLVLDRPPHTAMVVPSRYWSESFVDLWIGEASQARAG
jgi:hypothetical protein